MNVDLFVTVLERYQSLLATEAAQVDAMLAKVRPAPPKPTKGALATAAAAAASLPLYSPGAEPDEDDVEPTGGKTGGGKNRQQLLGQLRGGVTA